MSLAVRYAGCALLGLAVEMIAEGAHPGFAAAVLALALLMIIDSARP